MRDDKIMRGNNRDRSGINGEFLCVKGRYAFDFVEHPERLQSPMLRNAATSFEPISWSKAFEIDRGDSSTAVKARGGKFGVIGSNHTTNEENYFLQKFARQGLGTKNIDHHRTGDLATFFDALSGKNDALATAGDLYTAKAVLVVGADLAQQHPFLSYPGSREFPASRRAYLCGHHRSGSRRQSGGRQRSRRRRAGNSRGVESLRDKLKAEGDLVIVFGDCDPGRRRCASWSRSAIRWAFR